MNTQPDYLGFIFLAISAILASTESHQRISVRTANVSKAFIGCPRDKCTIVPLVPEKIFVQKINFPPKYFLGNSNATAFGHSLANVAQLVEQRHGKA